MVKSSVKPIVSEITMVFQLKKDTVAYTENEF